MKKAKGETKSNIIEKQLTRELPLISIVTVVYNGEPHLEQTIQSVLSQTYKNIEYIVIDGGSTDGTVDIIEKYKDKITYWVSEPDKGIYDAMNKGIARAKGELIGIINADDWYENDAVENIIRSYKNNPKGGVFYGLLRAWENEEVHSIQGPTIKTLNQMMIAHPTCFVKRELYDLYGGFDTGYKIAGDYELMLRMLRQNVQFIFIESILANFRLGGVSGTQKKRTLIEKLRVKQKYGIISKPFFIFKKITTTIKSWI